MTDFVERFEQQRILIVGDVIADQFVYGAISRVSREAPVFILRHEQTETLAGGAANAAANVAALGGKAILLGVTGADTAGEKLHEKLIAANVETEFLVKSDSWQTTTKMRILAGQPHSPRQQVIRLDYENNAQIKLDVQNELIENLRVVTKREKICAVVISDYNYGAASDEIAATVREIANDLRIPVLIDSRFRLTAFSGATSATPNETEVEELLARKFTDDVDFAEACEKLRVTLNFSALLVTRGANGMLLLESNQSARHFPAVGSLEAVDVTGAGDTVMATYALAIAAGATHAEAANIANHAGGIVVMKRGTAIVTNSELLKTLS